jgi:hypothetical protein
MVRLGVDGSVDVTNEFGSAHVIVDLLGWLP